jgi:tRNA(Phe) wybutosine-synthesizing methylase Tyw3
VSNENFKTYADAMNQLLKMSTERMTRIEDGIDDIRNEVSALVRNSRKYSE